MWHRLPFADKARPAGYVPLQGAPPAPRRVAIPAGTVTLGARRADVAFGWDNEFEAHSVCDGMRVHVQRP